MDQKVTSKRESNNLILESGKKDNYGYQGISFPQRNFMCNFCNKEYKSPQALGGHMNVHRKDRARLYSSPPSIDDPNPNPKPNPIHVVSQPSSIQFENLLIRCIAQRLEPSNGRPVAACFIYKCLRQWKSFEAEKTNIFDRIIQTIDHDIEANNNKDVLAYWLSNTSTLLVLLQRTFEASETTVGERIEAKNPALLFKNS
ncbi:hypothetical protein CTI12_AA005600 [Artemisia annua]|uniref:C2H2-type domain-containing protein n=1 Tax=Artemisia annua TaxID=35608 RepID=A0A2U1PFT8_ARTAN|nr:hypothetical protein CTI12_AA005600 [Artemisia annua]